MTPLQKVTRALRDIGFAADEIRIGRMPGGGVRGYVLSSQFERTPQIDRQVRLWDELGERLDKRTLAQIAYILTVAPDEIDDGVRVPSRRSERRRADHRAGR